MSTNTCFLCDNAVAEENQCTKCDQGIKYCSKGHLQAHLGSIRLGKDKYQVSLEGENVHSLFILKL